MARFKLGLPEGAGIRWSPDDTVQKLHFDADKREKRLLREMTRAEAVKMAAKLGMAPPEVAPPLSEGAKTGIAAVGKRRREERAAADSSIRTLPNTGAICFP